MLLSWKVFGKLYLFWLPLRTQLFQCLQLDFFLLSYQIRSEGFFLALLPLFPLHLELTVFPYVELGPWQYAECTSLLAQSDSDLLTYTQWQDQNRPVHTFHKPDGSFECALVFAWDKSVSIHTYLPSHTYEIHL